MSRTAAGRGREVERKREKGREGQTERERGGRGRDRRKAFARRSIESENLLDTPPLHDKLPLHVPSCVPVCKTLGVKRVTRPLLERLAHNLPVDRSTVLERLQDRVVCEIVYWLLTLINRRSPSIHMGIHVLWKAVSRKKQTPGARINPVPLEVT